MDMNSIMKRINDKKATEKGGELFSRLIKVF
jgi:hypothetical protein